MTAGGTIEQFVV